MSYYFMPDEFGSDVDDYRSQGHDDEEAVRLTAWDWRQFWSVSDDDALIQLDPWKPPHLRDSDDETEPGDHP